MKHWRRLLERRRRQRRHSRHQATGVSTRDITLGSERAEREAISDNSLEVTVAEAGVDTRGLRGARRGCGKGELGPLALS
ncbi:hypothetical protein GN958_ATG23597 [Phytophthora infestans]|uniref:Uncharacterized protein n=1 Tax=Phytophthora infestans TaxID=4787 RepID=A0A8S9TMK0_PHYIN|nr:hypothetical protein GN958_ATG23597 [Phytophthora infestans]